MSEPLVFGILGSGALGGYYGARLHHAGFPVHFVIRSDFRTVKQNGLKVESPLGDFSISQPSIVPHLDALPPCDILAICAKTLANADFLKLPLAQHVKPGGAILILQNGMGYEEEFAQAFPSVGVLGGMCFLCAHRVGPGHIRHLDYGDIQLASMPHATPVLLTLLQRLAQAFEQAGIHAPINHDLGMSRWKKLVWNIPFNGLSVLLQASTDQLISQPASLQMVTDLMHEVAGAAAACGTPLPPHIVEAQLANTRQMTPYLPSMRLDWDQGRPMEIEAIYERPIARAAHFGYPMPRTRQLCQALLFMQNSRTLLP